MECRISEKAVHVPVRLRRSTNRHHLLNPRLFFLQHLTLEYRTFISSRFHGSDEYNMRKKKKEKSLSTNRRSVPFFFFFFFFFFCWTIIIEFVLTKPQNVSFRRRKGKRKEMQKTKKKNKNWFRVLSTCTYLRWAIQPERPDTFLGAALEE